MQKFYIYPIYTVSLLVMLIAIVPKKHIRGLAPYAILLGSFFELLVLFLMTYMFNLAGHKNFGPFGAFWVPFFPPIAWGIYFVMYFYVLPQNKSWTFFFPLISAIFSTLFANVLVNLDVFFIHYNRVIVPFLVYITWHSISTIIFIRLTSAEVKNTDTFASFKPAFLFKRFKKE